MLPNGHTEQLKLKVLVLRFIFKYVSEKVLGAH